MTAETEKPKRYTITEDEDWFYELSEAGEGDDVTVISAADLADYFETRDAWTAWQEKLGAMRKADRLLGLGLGKPVAAE